MFGAEIFTSEIFQKPAFFCSSHCCPGKGPMILHLDSYWCLFSLPFIWLSGLPSIRQPNWSFQNIQLTVLLPVRSPQCFLLPLDKIQSPKNVPRDLTPQNMLCFNVIPVERPYTLLFLINSYHSFTPLAYGWPVIIYRTNSLPQHVAPFCTVLTILFYDHVSVSVLPDKSCFRIGITSWSSLILALGRCARHSANHHWVKWVNE
jgi:hypothetical protein